MSVDDFLDGLTGWQREQCTLVVRTIRGASDEITESIKWANPYFDLNGSFIKLFVAKDWINIYFYKGNLLQDLLFEPSKNNKMRTVKVYKSRPIDEVVFNRLVHAAAQLNQ